MTYTLELEKSFRAVQGLASPVRRAKGLPGLQPKEGYEFTISVSIDFQETQLNDRGWFVDSDMVDTELEKLVAYLTSKPWIELFSFRPTFEQVAHWAFKRLQPHVDQLTTITLKNKTLGVYVAYTKEQL